MRIIETFQRLVPSSNHIPNTLLVDVGNCFISRRVRIMKASFPTVVIALIKTTWLELSQ